MRILLLIVFGNKIPRCPISDRTVLFEGIGLSLVDKDLCQMITKNELDLFLFYCFFVFSNRCYRPLQTFSVEQQAKTSNFPTVSAARFMTYHAFQFISLK